MKTKDKNSKTDVVVNEDGDYFEVATPTASPTMYSIDEISKAYYKAGEKFLDNPSWKDVLEELNKIRKSNY